MTATTPASTDSPPTRTRRSEQTRDRILRVAVRLFAQRGIEGVSLNDINKAAGQRNKNATHYHFGSKDGLLQAIIDRYEPPIARRRNELLDQYEREGGLNLRKTIRALLLPMAAQLDAPDGGADFVRFSAHLVTTHTMEYLQMRAPSYRVDSIERIARAIDAQLDVLPPAIKMERGLLLGVFLTHALAERSRLRAGRQTPDADHNALFIANLEDCLVAMMAQAPQAAADVAAGLTPSP